MKKMISKLKQFLDNRSSDQVLKVIPVMNLMIGNYVNMTESKLINYLLRIYCVAIFILIISGYIKYLTYTTTYTLAILAVEYTSVFFLQFINGENCLATFITTIQTYDRIKGYSKIPLFNYTTWLIVALILIFRIIIFAIRIVTIPDDWLKVFGVTLILISLDLNFLTISIVFMVCYGRLKLLRKSMGTNDVYINIALRDSVAERIRNIKMNVRYYSHLLDSVQMIDIHLQILLFTHLITHGTKILLLLENVIKSLFLTLNYFTLSSILEAFYSLFLIFGPAIIMEAITLEMNQIKMTLCAQLLRQTDESIHFELNTALQYVNLRPFQCIICHLLPLNIQLPFTIIGVCITYIIVSLQLTHFSG